MGAEVSNTEQGVNYVKGSTPTKSLATFITTSALTDRVKVLRLRAIGAGAVNQMVKGLITSEGRLIEKGIRLATKMSYQDIETEGGGKVSAIQMVITFDYD